MVSAISTLIFICKTNNMHRKSLYRHSANVAFCTPRPTHEHADLAPSASVGQMIRMLPLILAATSPTVIISFQLNL